MKFKYWNKVTDCNNRLLEINYNNVSDSDCHFSVKCEQEYVPVEQIQVALSLRDSTVCIRYNKQVKVM